MRNSIKTKASKNPQIDNLIKEELTKIPAKMESIDMKKLIILLCILFVGGIFVYWHASHHILKTDNGLLILNKRFLTFHDTYVDIRSWDSAAFDSNPQLKRAMIEQGYKDILVDLKTQELKAAIKDIGKQAEFKTEEITQTIQRKVNEWLDEYGPSTWKKIKKNSTKVTPQQSDISSPNEPSSGEQ